MYCIASYKAPEYSGRICKAHQLSLTILFHYLQDRLPRLPFLAFLLKEWYQNYKSFYLVLMSHSYYPKLAKHYPCYLPLIKKLLILGYGNKTFCQKYYQEPISKNLLENDKYLYQFRSKFCF